MELRGATAIVTGASRGIGVHIARELAGNGVNLVLAARSADELDKVRDEMVGFGVKAAAIVCDVVDPAARAVLVERAQAEIGPIDIVVNNAGIETARQFHTTPENDLEQVLDVNLIASMMLTRAVLPGMLVAKVVVSCIRRNRGEVLVNFPPVRPLVALLNIAPGTEPALMRILGYTRMFERAAEIEQRRATDG